jgi:hypothetical protein
VVLHADRVEGKTFRMCLMKRGEMQPPPGNTIFRSWADGLHNSALEFRPKTFDAIYKNYELPQELHEDFCNIFDRLLIVAPPVTPAAPPVPPAADAFDFWEWNLQLQGARRAGDSARVRELMNQHRVWMGLKPQVVVAPEPDERSWWKCEGEYDTLLRWVTINTPAFGDFTITAHYPSDRCQLEVKIPGPNPLTYRASLFHLDYQAANTLAPRAEFTAVLPTTDGGFAPLPRFKCTVDAVVELTLFLTHKNNLERGFNFRDQIVTRVNGLITFEFGADATLDVLQGVCQNIAATGDTTMLETLQPVATYTGERRVVRIDNAVPDGVPVLWYKCEGEYHTLLRWLVSAVETVIGDFIINTHWPSERCHLEVEWRVVHPAATRVYRASLRTHDHLAADTLVPREEFTRVLPPATHAAHHNGRYETLPRFKCTVDHVVDLTLFLTHKNNLERGFNFQNENVTRVNGLITFEFGADATFDVLLGVCRSIAATGDTAMLETLQPVATYTGERDSGVQ